MLLIYVLSSVSRYPEILPEIFNLDKFIHTIEYYILGYLFMRVLVTSPRTVFTSAPAVFAIAFGMMYAISDEWHQSFVPGRDASVYDVLFDILGIVIAVATYRLARRRVKWIRRVEDVIEAGKRKLVITVDGPAGSGKSTVSRILAKRISYTYLDTGILYRAVAWRVMKRGVPIADDKALGEVCNGITIHMETNGQMRVLVEGENVSGDLRTEEIGMLASSVSAIPAVREALLPLQRSAGWQGGIVAEGRDMGTVVFPDADVKFFLDADADERARRRYLQLVENGKNADRGEIKRGLEVRDHQDTTREIAPLKPAGDSVVIDTTGIDIEGVVEKMAMIVKECARRAACRVS